MNPNKIRDHGGGIDAAVARFGGDKKHWLDLSTGINPLPYPVPQFTPECWGTLPDRAAFDALERAARNFWKIPDGAGVLAAPGASSLIAQIPTLAPAATATIPGPTYNEHEAAYRHHGWAVGTDGATAQSIVHPNNPDGRLWDADSITNTNSTLTIIDESFCDVAPDQSHINLSTRPGTLILKSFGKFWGLAGLRLGFAIGDPILITKLTASLGPWQVSGPALSVGTAALNDTKWAAETRARLAGDAARLDQMMNAKGAATIGGTTLFRLYHVDSARDWQDRLAKSHIWTRVFPYSDNWLRLGLPAPHQWAQLTDAL